VLRWREAGFQLTGQGPPDLVLLRPVADLEAEWERPDRAVLLASLSRLGRVIRFSSDASSRLLDVLDGAASERAVLVAEQVAAAPVVGWVAEHPSRVSALVLFGVSAGESARVLPDDVAASLGRVAVPTLVLHRSGDPVVEVAHGRLLAAQIPGAEFRALPGDRHEPEADPE
jgi:pimeloyl-ACP methyl ester carboxylesterase